MLYLNFHMILNIIILQTTELEDAHSEIEKLTALLQEAQEFRSAINEEERLDHITLLAAMESDKLAAARAVSQNQTLKQQVTNLEDTMAALVILSIFFLIRSGKC